MENKLFQFDLALNLLRQGKKLTRTGWNGKGLFITLQVPDEHSKMTKPYIYITIPAIEDGDVGTSEQRVPWLTSQTDLLSSDWTEVL